MKTLKILLINLLLLCLLLAGLELFLRLTNPDYQYYFRTNPAQPNLEEVLAANKGQWLREDAELGWVCKQDSLLLFPSPPLAGIPYQINTQGFRMPFDLGDSLPAGKKKVLLLGDSFLFGIYLPEQETITAQLQRIKGEDYVFYTLAVPAWGLDQMYLAYQQYVDLIQPDQVLMAFVDDDFMRTQEILFHGCGRKPCLKLEDDQLVPNADGPQFWEFLCWHNQLGNRLLLGYYERKAARLCQFFFADIIQHEKQAGRSPAFMRIPAKVDLDRQEAREVFSMESFMTEQGVRYTELYGSFSEMGPVRYSRLYIPDDGHPTTVGAKRLAQELAGLID